jgi:carboxypeptidase family protein/TonB-dependent receptor-like protein
MNLRRLACACACAVAILFVCSTLLAQGTVTGQLTGTVAAGATVTVTSPQLQAPRTTTSDINGDYLFAGLPPGDYTITFEMAGTKSVTKSAKVSLSGTTRVDVELSQNPVHESVTVTPETPAVLEGTQTQATLQQKLVNELPTARTPTAIALLAPGTTTNGPRGALQISGATSNDNLILVDGSSIQENLRGQPRQLYIEDAIQETTVMTAGVSPEFGRFTGGVVNAVSKSGGNDLSGTLRDTLTNSSWGSLTKFGREHPGSETLADDVNNTYEGTVGGPILADRLWFFGAARYSSVSANGGNLAGGGPSFIQKTTNRRLEAKLTGQITPRHSLQGTYLKSPLAQTNNNQRGAWEEAALDPSIAQHEAFRSLHYNGIPTNNLTLEANWSNRRHIFVGLGGENTDPLLGTPLFISFGNGNVNTGIANAPYFCGVCSQEHRDNTLETLKATYFVGTRALGTHSIVGGADNYDEFRRSNDYQSPTNLVLRLITDVPVRDASGNVLYTVEGPDAKGKASGDDVEYYPVLSPSLGSHLKTRSLFLNDTWDLNNHFSFNLGARYDRNDAVDQSGNKTSDDHTISPRLGASFDVNGNGRLRVNATYGTYAGRLAETVQGAGSFAGEPATYTFLYRGPTFKGTSAQVVAQMLAWFNLQGGIAGAKPDSVNIGGVTTQILGSLDSPRVREYTVGLGSQISGRSFVRADYINRKWTHSYVGITDATTGVARNAAGQVLGDKTLITNTDLIRRDYRGVQLQVGTTVLERFNVGGNYTYSKLRGNQELETQQTGPTFGGGSIFQYPELQGFAQNAPEGYLAGDQRHKLRTWVNTGLALGRVGRLELSVLERYDSGTPYSASGQIAAQANPAVTLPAYVQKPAAVTYFFSGRGAYRWDNIYRTDFAAEYAFPIARGEMFVKGEVFNLFDQQRVIAGDTTVITSRSSALACHNAAGAAARCQAFNPFTATPVEGTNYALSPTFGQGTSAASFEPARSYDFAIGVRF